MKINFSKKMLRELDKNGELEKLIAELEKMGMDTGLLKQEVGKHQSKRKRPGKK